MSRLWVTFTKLFALQLGLLLSAGNMPCHAQQLPLTCYDAKNGIDFMRTVCTFQDSKGWIWVSTGNGVYRYEGSAFRYFAPPPGYSWHFVFAFYEVDGAIWCEDNYERIFTIRDEQVKLLNNTQGIFPKFRSFTQTPGGKYYLAELGLYEYRSDRFLPLYAEPSKNPRDGGNEETPMVAFQDSLLLYTKKDGSLVIFNLHERRQFITNYKTTGFGQDRHGRLWIMNREWEFRELKDIDWQHRTLNLLPVPERYRQLPHYGYSGFVWDPQDNLWLLASEKGLVNISTEGQIKVYTEKDGLPGVSFLHLMIDRENNIWIAADGYFAKVCLNEPLRQYGVGEGLLSNKIWSLFTFPASNGGPGTAWAFTKDLQKFNDGKWQNLAYKGLTDSFPNIFRAGEKIYAYSSHVLYELSLDRDENRIIKSNRLLSLANYFYPSPWGLTKIIPAGKDTLLVGTIFGLHIYHNGRFYKVQGIKSGEQHIYAILVDKKGFLWLGIFGDGLYQCRIERGKEGRSKDSIRIIDYTYYKQPEAGMPEITWIRSLAEDKDGNIWVGTRYNGLFHLCRNAAGAVTEVHHYGPDEGLSDNTIWDIKKDRQGRFWLATSRGLDLVSKNNHGTWQIEQMGGRFNIRNSRMITITDNNILWAENFPGITRVDLDKALFQQSFPFQVAITRCSIEGQPDTTAARGILRTEAHNLLFELGENTYINENYAKYSYLLEGGSESWTPFSNNFRINFSNLRPGKYVFRARAMNKDGKISTNTAIYPFIILPPFYERSWFLAAAGLLFAAGVYTLYRYRMRQIRKQARFELELAESEMKALRAQMNPHFIFNCMAAIDNFIIRNDRKNASGFLNKFAKLVRQVLENSQHDLIDLRSDLTCLELYIQLEQIRFGHTFNYKIAVDEQLKARGMQLPPLLFQPFVENAIIHGLRHKTNGDRKLSFDLFREGEVVKGIVRDNGVGRGAASKMSTGLAHSPLGMKIAEERLRLLKQAGSFDARVTVNDLYDHSGNPAGTEVIIELSRIVPKSSNYD